MSQPDKTVTAISKSDPAGLGQAIGIQSSTEVTFVEKAEVSKQEAGLIQSHSMEIEDKFEQHYFNAESNKSGVVIRPPYDFSQLSLLVQENNALGQCISAMEVNIDGTGYVIESKEKTESKEENTKAKGVQEFFDEAYPGQSFVTQRRALRRDQESTGNAYLEVLRAINNDLVFLKRIDAKSMRMVKLDDSVPVIRTVKRFGTEHKINMMIRPRRFVQIMGKKLVYFKEYGFEGNLNRETGEWEHEDKEVPVDKRATEVIHFTAIKDVNTPYGVPRWVTQIPSVIGSRKAEELNLDFFNAGGLPPALVILQGGTMTDPVRKQLQSYLSGKGASKHRAAIIEAYSTSGDISSSGSGVRVTVERFGAERQQDSMFEKYDDKCERRVRSSFRLPPLFVGKAEDYSFATAFASYAVAEAQVFTPEREEFDEMINVTLMKELADDLVFRSSPLSVKDAANQLKGIELLAKNQAIDNEEFVDAINEVTNMNIKVSAITKDDLSTDGKGGLGAGNKTATPAPGASPDGGSPTPVQKGDPAEFLKIAQDWAAYTAGDKEFTKDSASTMRQTIELMSKGEREVFDNYVAMQIMTGYNIDQDGSAELCGCASDILSQSE